MILSKRGEIKMNKIVVYGGSFNPPHNSHFVIAQQVINQLENVESVIFIPVNSKYCKSHLEDNIHRYHMLDIVIKKNPNFLLSDMDLKEEKSLSTIETLERVKKQFPDKEICFLLGSDNLRETHGWVRAEEIMKNYKIIVMERADDDVESIINHDDFLNKHRDNIIKLDVSLKSNCSATFLRNQIKRHKSIQYLLPDEVYEYIKINHLYEEG